MIPGLLWLIHTILWRKVFHEKSKKERGIAGSLSDSMFGNYCVRLFCFSKIAQNFNTQNLELITGLYVEKMNEEMDYFQNFVEEDVKMIQAMEDKDPAKIQKSLEKNLNQTMFCNIGFIMKNGEVYGSNVQSQILKRKIWIIWL